MRTCFPEKIINPEKNAANGVQNQETPSFTGTFPQNDSQIRRRCTVFTGILQAPYHFFISPADQKNTSKAPLCTQKPLVGSWG